MILVQFLKVVLYFWPLTASLQWSKTLSMSILGMTLNNLMVRLQSTPSSPLLPGLLWFKVVATDRVLSMGQIEQFDI